MQIKFIKPGLHTTIQDLGRINFLSQAVPLSGALDPLSAKIANLAVGNLLTAAVLEFTYANASFRCETALLIAYAGGGSTMTVNGEKLPARRAIFLPAGTVVALVNNHIGVRTYLSVAGGWDVPKILDSSSTYLPAAFGGYAGRLLKKDDLISNGNPYGSIASRILDQLNSGSVRYNTWGIPDHFLSPKEKNTIRIFAGREITWFDSNSIIDLLSLPFNVDLKSNRMGILLKGNQMKRKINQELLSTAVCPGTIQVTGNGELILLMADCQTTGGYPRIAQVAMVDIPICAQLKPREEIYFSVIDYSEAEQLYYQQEAELERLAHAIYTK